jgi:hypothetical protein
MPQGEPVSASGIDSNSYDSGTSILTLTAGKNEITSNVAINYQSAPPSSLFSTSTSTTPSIPTSNTPSKPESSSPKLPVSNSNSSPTPTPSPLPSPSLPNMSIPSDRNSSELRTPSLTNDSEVSSLYHCPPSLIFHL